MNRQERQRLLQQLETVIEQSHRLQLDLLRLLRSTVEIEPASDSPQFEAQAPDASVEVDLPDKPTFSVKVTAELLGLAS